MHRPRLLLLLYLAVLLAFMPQAARSSSPSVVSIPTLKWAYGGCFASWCQTGWYSSPAIADMNKDGKAEVIWGSYDLVALQGDTGSLIWRAASTNRVWSGVAIDDIDHDGALDIAVGRSGDRLSLYSAAGAERWSRSPFGLGELRTLALADLEQDGSIEIIVGRAGSGATRQLSVYQADGSLRHGWPARRDGDPGSGWGLYNQNVAVGDMTGDGIAELIVPTDTHYITGLGPDGSQLPVNPIYGAGKAWSQVGVHVDHAVDLRGYANCGSEHRPNFANSAPVIDDLDGDGTRELIVIGNVYNCATDPYTDLYLTPFVLRADRTRWAASGFDWTVVPADPGTRPRSQDYNVIENSLPSPATADLDNDGHKEILFSSYDGRVYAYWLDKTQHGSWPFVVPGQGINFASEPAVADLDNDGQAEVIIGTWPQIGSGRAGQIIILNSQGQILHQIQLPPQRSGNWNGALAAPTIANIDSDTDLEVILGTAHSGVVAYDLPNSATARVLWGTGRGSFLRNGLAPQTGPVLQVSPAWQAIEPGSQASFTILLRGIAGNESYSLNAVSNPSDLMVELAETSIGADAPVSLIVRDMHPQGILQPGVYYSVSITASGPQGTLKREIAILVGGYHVALPAIRR